MDNAACKGVCDVRMGNKQNGTPLLVIMLNDPENLSGILGIEVSCWFICKE
jgi:hypothetical protein